MTHPSYTKNLLLLSPLSLWSVSPNPAVAGAVAVETASRAMTGQIRQPFGGTFLYILQTYETCRFDYPPSGRHCVRGHHVTIEALSFSFSLSLCVYAFVRVVAIWRVQISPSTRMGQMISSAFYNNGRSLDITETVRHKEQRLAWLSDFARLHQVASVPEKRSAQVMPLIFFAVPSE